MVYSARVWEERRRAAAAERHRRPRGDGFRAVHRAADRHGVWRSGLWRRDERLVDDGGGDIPGLLGTFVGGCRSECSLPAATVRRVGPDSTERVDGGGPGRGSDSHLRRPADDASGGHQQRPRRIDHGSSSRLCGAVHGQPVHGDFAVPPVVQERPKAGRHRGPRDHRRGGPGRAGAAVCHGLRSTSRCHGRLPINAGVLRAGHRGRNGGAATGEHLYQ